MHCPWKVLSQKEPFECLLLFLTQIEFEEAHILYTYDLKKHTYTHITKILNKRNALEIHKFRYVQYLRLDYPQI